MHTVFLLSDVSPLLRFISPRSIVFAGINTSKRVISDLLYINTTGYKQLSFLFPWVQNQWLLSAASWLFC